MTILKGVFVTPQFITIMSPSYLVICNAIFLCDIVCICVCGSGRVITLVCLVNRVYILFLFYHRAKHENESVNMYNTLLG